MSPEIEKTGFGRKVPVQNSLNRRNEEFSGSPMSKSKSYKFKMEQNSSPEFLSLLFLELFHKHGPTMAETCITYFC